MEHNTSDTSATSSASANSPWSEGEKAQLENARYEMKVAEALIDELGYHEVFQHYLTTCMGLDLAPSSATLALLKAQASQIAAILVVSEGMGKEDEAYQRETIEKLSKCFVEYLSHGLPEGLKKLDQIRQEKEQS